MKELIPRQWQIDAYNKWVNEGLEKASVIAATGAGKTHLGLMAIYKNFDRKFYIIVPTIRLQIQWRNAILKQFPELSGKLSLVGGGNNDWTKQIVIAVVNSTRGKAPDDAEERIAILDEAHRYGSAENQFFVIANNFLKVLAITATPNDECPVMRKFPPVYTIDQKDCIDNEYLCEYDLINKAVDLSLEESEALKKCNNIIRFEMMRTGFIRSKGVLAKRRKLLLNAESKMSAAVDLVQQNPNRKIIIFTEFKNSADHIHRLLREAKIPCSKFYSGMKKDESDKAIYDFSDNITNILITVKALDEGIDVPDCDMAIIVGGSSVERQMIQRLGRILRHKVGKEAVVYQLYIAGTKDEEWLKKRTRSFVGVAKTISWVR